MTDESQQQKAKVLSVLHADGIVPILRTPTANDALELAEALLEAGLHNVEIPLTVPHATDVIRELSVSFSPDLQVGVGSVFHIDDAIMAMEAGATFVVTPVFDASVISFCRGNGLACFPGALTPSEIFTAWSAGADAVKVFPASAVGGAEYIASIKAPMPQIRLMPTGGVSIQNVASFIESGAWAVGVGGELTDVAAIRSGNRGLIKDRASIFMELVHEARNVRNKTTPPPPTEIDVDHKM